MGGLDIIALADHDTLAGVDDARAAGAGAVHVIPALELSTTLAGAELHMLGYFVDTKNDALVSYCARASGGREMRMKVMVDRLNDAGVPVAYEDVLAAAGPKRESIGRPHLARALVKKGLATSVSEAFDRLIGDHAAAFEPTRLITPLQAIELIHGAGGVAVWAHPRPDVLEPQLPEMVAWGLDGVECYRPRMVPIEADRYAALARQHGLFTTGGSDWHGEWQGRLGDFSIDRDDVAEFLEVGGI